MPQQQQWGDDKTLMIKKERKRGEGVCEIESGYTNDYMVTNENHIGRSNYLVFTN